MTMNRHGSLGLALLALCCTPEAPASAQPAPTQGVVQVRAQVVSGCRVSTRPDLIANLDFGTLDFGRQPALFGTALTARSQGEGGVLRLRCTGVPGVQVTVGLGLHPDGNQRRLNAGPHHVPYALYADAAFSQAYEGYAPRALPVSPGGEEAEFELAIYGRIDPVPGGYPAGLYSDRVGITVSW